MRTAGSMVLKLASGGVCAFGLAQAATPVAELPLKASVLAKPNIIFAMDDSGSMDWEVLLDTDSGLLYWDEGTSSAWDSTRQKPRRTGVDRREYGYLFPMGTANGGALYSGDWYSKIAPPIDQLAWTRSSRFNPIYYDSRVTYPAWSPAYFGGSTKNYSNASTTAAISHPGVAGAQTLNLTVNWPIASGDLDQNGWRFFVQNGMTLPAGTSVESSATGAGGVPCTGSVRTLTAAQQVTGNRTCYAIIPYYPATFWHWLNPALGETCTLGTNCVAAPDGVGRLQRYEIRSTVTTYPSGRTYAQEIQNFANWFTYYRKRKLMLAGSMGRVMENISGVRMGVVPFNSSPTITMRDADNTTASQNRLAVAGEFYLNGMSALGTPTHAAVTHIASQFANNNSVIQYACQRNNTFVVTDGFSNTTSYAVPSYSASLWGATAPFTTIHTGSLADLALSNYTRRLRTDLPAGRVPVSSSTAASADRNPDLHINTYAITLGVRGGLWPNTVDPFVTAPTWPTPTADDPSMIDDQWHATINGRGKMYLATTPDETVASLRAGIEDMLSMRNTQSAVAVSSVNLDRGDTRAYQSKYDPAGWAGDIERVSVSASTGAIGTMPSWCASVRLNSDNWASRVIASHNGSGGVLFNAASVGGLVGTGGTAGTATQVVDYLRGDVTNEGTLFRNRKRLKLQTELLARCGVTASSLTDTAANLLGAVINAEPASDRVTGVVYASTGEGMLHALDADTGNELWAYVPGAALADLGATAARGYAFKTQLDGSPVIRSIGSTRLLVSGMGVAGRSFFALDVTTPKSYNASSLPGKALWEFPAAGDTTTKNKVGQAVGKPLIVKLAGGQYGVVVSSGYNNNDGIGRVWVLNASTGVVLKEYSTGVGTTMAESGLAHLAGMAELDGTVKYVYGGDLLGNVWRVDLTKAATDSTAVQLIAQLKSSASVVQPVTSVPELAFHKTPNGTTKRIIYLGTGRLLDSTDFGSSSVQSVYAISDEGASLTPSARTSLVQQVLNTSGVGSLTSNTVNWDIHRGWYVDLPAGDQVNNRPSLGFGGLAVVANQTGASDCAASSRLYVIDALTGSKFADVGFVVTTLSTSSNATAPVLVRTSTGAVKALVNFYEKDQTTGSEGASTNVSTSRPAVPSKNAWREIRR
jgi:type IV pilus assembly protein PilY1